MKVRIEFEVPQWTRWLGAGLILGLFVGYVSGVVHAGTDPDILTWKDGDTLTADALNKNFAELRDAVTKLGTLDCPRDYTRDATASQNIVVCRKGVDEVVKVGTSGNSFWIDRYEASVWNSFSEPTMAYGVTGSDFPVTFPITGQYITPLYALSVPNVQPSAYLSWFQADAACEASGKRLPTGSEWLRAARGTKDPGESDGTSGHCLTLQIPFTGRKTALGTDCISRWGAQDMIGNYWEMTSDWFITVPSGADFQTNQSWQNPAFNGDINYNIKNAVSDEQGNISNLPAIAVRGGGFKSGTEAGVFAVNLMLGPSRADYLLSFRCVIQQ